MLSKKYFILEYLRLVLSLCSVGYSYYRCQVQDFRFCLVPAPAPLYALLSCTLPDGVFVDFILHQIHCAIVLTEIET